MPLRLLLWTSLLRVTHLSWHHLAAITFAQFVSATTLRTLAELITQIGKSKTMTLFVNMLKSGEMHPAPKIVRKYLQHMALDGRFFVETALLEPWLSACR